MLKFNLNRKFIQSFSIISTIHLHLLSVQNTNKIAKLWIVKRNTQELVVTVVVVTSSWINRENGFEIQNKDTESINHILRKPYNAAHCIHIYFFVYSICLHCNDNKLHEIQMLKHSIFRWCSRWIGKTFFFFFFFFRCYIMRKTLFVL